VIEAIDRFADPIVVHLPGAEEDDAFQFASAHFITLGLLQRLLTLPPPTGLEQRRRRAEPVRTADEALTAEVDRRKRRGRRHPDVRPVVLARAAPRTRARDPALVRGQVPEARRDY